MIHYKDMTFCREEGCKKFGVDCFRSFTKDVSKAADAWWGEGEGEAPVCLFYGKPDCFEEKSE